MASPLNNVNIGLLHQNSNFSTRRQFNANFIPFFFFRDAELIREKQQKKGGGSGGTDGGANAGKS